MNKATSNKARPSLQIARPSSGVQRSAAALAIEDDDARIVINCTKALRTRVKVHATQKGMTIRDYMLQLLAKDGIE